MPTTMPTVLDRQYPDTAYGRAAEAHDIAKHRAWYDFTQEALSDAWRAYSNGRTTQARRILAKQIRENQGFIERDRVERNERPADHILTSENWALTEFLISLCE